MNLRSELPAALAALNLITYVTMLGFGLVLLLFPAATSVLAIHEYAAAPLAVLLALNVLVLGLCAAALQFKSGPAWWCIYIVGAATVAVWLIVALDAALVWQILAQQRWDRLWVTALLLPAIPLSWLGGKLAGQKKSAADAALVIDAAFEPEPVAGEPVRPPLINRLVRLAVITVRFAVIAICVVQLCILAAGLVLAIYAVMHAILFNDQVIAPRQMGGILAAVSDSFLTRYAQIALPLAKTTALYVFGFMALMITVVVPVSFALGGGLKLLTRKRQELPLESRAWIEGSAREMMRWYSERPHKGWDSLVVTIIIILTFCLGAAVLSVPSWWLAAWMNGLVLSGDGEVFREQLGGAGMVAGGIVGFFVFMVLGLAGTQLLPGLKAYWASTNRKRVESQPALVLQETLAGLDSAASKGWYPMSVPFDPDAFLRRWLGRNVNAANKGLLLSLPVIFALTIADAYWFRSWGETVLRESGPFEFVVHTRPYGEAIRVETTCRVDEARDGELSARSDYVIVFDEGHRFSLRRRLNPGQLERLIVIDRALRTSGLSVVETAGDEHEGSGRTACYALLRGRYGEDGVRLADVLTGTGN